MIRERNGCGLTMLSYFFLIVVGATMLIPLLWMVLTSLKPPNTDVMDLATMLDGPPDHWQNYATVWGATDFGRAFYNSVLVTFFVTFGLLVTSSLAAFAFARLRFFGRDGIFFGYLATMMVPEVVTMIPTFLLLRALGWIDTYAALILPAMFSAYGTFMLRQFFLDLPRELEEAAIIDGCSTFGVYRHVALPLSTPALAALGILTFMGAWRSFMWPLIVVQTPEMFTLPVALAQFQEMYGVQWALLMAGSVIMILPMLVIFVFGQRYFIHGIRIGAVKG